MYDLITGPLLWFSFIVCIGGVIIRLVYLFSLSRVKDRVLYNHADAGWGLRSLFHWLIPFAGSAMRMQPVFTFMGFVFHLSLLSVPLFLSAHNILWDENFGISLWSMPDRLADILSAVTIISGLFLFLRRLSRLRFVYYLKYGITF